MLNRTGGLINATVKHSPVLRFMDGTKPSEQPITPEQQLLADFYQEVTTEHNRIIQEGLVVVGAFYVATETVLERHGIKVQG